MQKIIPHLWFDTQAEEAAKFYTTLFAHAQLGNIARYSQVGQEIHGQKPGTVMTVAFELEGCQFIGLNGGPLFEFTPAISFIVNCESKEEIDRLWEGFLEGGSVLMKLDKYDFSERYGWIEDKFGVSWQLFLSGDTPQKIVPSLMFTGAQAGNAEAAIRFYTTTFKQGHLGQIHYYPSGMEPDKEGSVMFADFTLYDQWFAAMDSAQKHSFAGFSEAISLLVYCDTQEEIDTLWSKLSADPASEQCGWLKDKFGLSWQITPPILDEMLRDETSAKSQRVMKAMLQMKKLNIAALEAAYEGKG